MSSKFLKTSHNATIGNLIQGITVRLDNPYYVFTDKKPTPVTYLNLSEKSTYDEGSENVFAPLGEESPLRYNKIENALLFGLDRMLAELDIGDYGLEANAIEGEAVVLPNTFIPYPDDYFSIDYLNKKLLFRVTAVTTDTLENKANFYKISYKFDQYDKDISSQIIDSFKMVTNNVGTEYKSIIKTKDYDFIEDMENILNRLKTYYADLFFNSKVQTFTFGYNDKYFYDPYMIEFLIRNDILNGGDEYIYVSHQVYNGQAFSLEYDKTFFRNIELKNKAFNLKTAYAILIQDPTSLLSTRYEDYYKIDYKGNVLMYPIPVVDIELVDAIKANTKFDRGEKEVYNIIVDYFNKGDFDSNSVSILENLDFESNIVLFYNIPIIIYIIEDTIKSLLLKTNSN